MRNPTRYFTDSIHTTQDAKPIVAKAIYNRILRYVDD